MTFGPRYGDRRFILKRLRMLKPKDVNGETTIGRIEEGFSLTPESKKAG
jgi:hypothetical protein